MATEQKPLKSGFGAKTTAREVLAGRDLTGTTAVVTGGYSGVGLETTRALAEAGATVVVPARTQEKARTVLAGIPRVEIETLELIDPASIDAFAGRFLGSERPLDVLINNAGIMAPPLRRDARGYESQFATNHLVQNQPTILDGRRVCEDRAHERTDLCPIFDRRRARHAALRAALGPGLHAAPQPNSLAQCWLPYSFGTRA